MNCRKKNHEIILAINSGEGSSKYPQVLSSSRVIFVGAPAAPMSTTLLKRSGKSIIKLSEIAPPIELPTRWAFFYFFQGIEQTN